MISGVILKSWDKLSIEIKRYNHHLYLYLYCYFYYYYNEGRTTSSTRCMEKDPENHLVQSTLWFEGQDKLRLGIYQNYPGMFHDSCMLTLLRPNTQNYITGVYSPSGLKNVLL